MDASGDRPVLVVVVGAPGSGKTTLARALAVSLGGPALVRDELKEGLARTIPGYLPSPSDALTFRATAAFFATLIDWLEAGISHVAEAAFAEPLWREGLAPVLDGTTATSGVRLVRCVLAPSGARERLRRRLVNEPARAVHDDLAHLDLAPPYRLPDLGVPTLDVDTTDGHRPSLDEVVAFARS